RGDYDDAVEFARVAEQRADALIREHDEALAAEERARRDTARAGIDKIKKLIDDLSRADIEILGAKDAVSKAEAALDGKKYDRVAAELAGVSADAQSVSEGLRIAAMELVTMAARTIETAKAEGYEIPRADHVLVNAQDAINDQRFVEAIEYKKVIEDIIADARRQRGFGLMEAKIQTLRQDLEASEKVGVDIRSTSELLQRAEDDLRSGRFDTIESYAKQIADSLAMSKKRRVEDRLTESARL